MLGFIKARRRVHLLHIGKTGGTAVRQALRPYRYLVYNLQLHGHGRKLPGVPEGEKVVVFLRDPLSRLTSGFYSRYRKGQPRYFSEWSDFEARFFETFQTPNAWAQALGGSGDSHHALAVEGMTEIVHLKPYTHWLESVEYFQSRRADLLLVGHLESLDDDFMRLRRRLLVPPHARLPSGEIESHRTPSYMDRRLSDAAVAAIRHHYVEDFALREWALSLPA